MIKKRGIKKKRELFFILVILLVGLFLSVESVDAQVASLCDTYDTSSYFCAEKTTNGAWCMNVPCDEVDTSYDYTQTSCEATSFCITGTCVNAVEGSCRPNVPRRVCEADGGIWDERPRDEISRCQLGCCYIGSGASFITQTKCTSQAGRHGIEVKFDPGIRDSLKCLASAYPEEKGACVTDDGFVRNCTMSTSKECDTKKASASGDKTVEFHRGTLCTAAGLETICGPTERTTLVENKDEVFFVDSCGNPANIYDASKINPVVQEYWEDIIDKKDSCVLSSENIASCGNCDYGNMILGSIGKKYEINKNMIKPEYGDYVCAALSCMNGDYAEDFKERFERDPNHGESWCGTTSTGSEDYLPGSEHFKFICDFGEVRIEPLDPKRRTICVESSIPIENLEGGFRTANPRANKYQDCVTIDNKADCEDTQERDCVWINGTGATIGSLHADEDINPLVVNKDGELVPKDELEFGDPGVKMSPFGLIKIGTGAACIPKYPPALSFWKEPNKTKQEIQESAADDCSIASEICIVKFEDPKLFGATTCAENCYCLGIKKGDDPTRMKDGSLKDIKLDDENEWLMSKIEICKALGDCGVSENYVGGQGNWKLEDLVEVTELKEE